MGEAAEVLNTAFFKNLKLKLLAIPSLRLNTKYNKQYNNISEKNLKNFRLLKNSLKQNFLDNQLKKIKTTN